MAEGESKGVELFSGSVEELRKKDLVVRDGEGEDVRLERRDEPRFVSLDQCEGIVRRSRGIEGPSLVDVVVERSVRRDGDQGTGASVWIRIEDSFAGSAVVEGGMRSEVHRREEDEAGDERIVAESDGEEGGGSAGVGNVIGVHRISRTGTTAGEVGGLLEDCGLL